MAWSKWVEEAGLRARLFERPRSPCIQYDHTDPLSGKRSRRSTKRTDRKEAADFVKRVLRARAEMGPGEVGAKVTLGTVFKLHAEHRLPHLSLKWQRTGATRRALFERAWGVNKRLEDIGQSDVDTYTALRRSGELRPAGKVSSKTKSGVSDGTIESELRWLSTVLRWGRGFKVGGRRLVPFNPLDGLRRPHEKNRKRPIASNDRYLRTLAKADEVDPLGRLACMLTLARFTGRRQVAIGHLWASDLLRTSEAVRDAIAAMGMDESRADFFPHGGLRWRAEEDKQGYDTLTPLSPPARQALDAYLSRTPRVGDTPLFPFGPDSPKPVTSGQSSTWLRRAEVLAGLPKLVQGGWHPYRRLFATELKGVPIQDVAAAAGWRSIETVQRLYQQSEASGILAAVNLVGNGGSK